VNILVTGCAGFIGSHLCRKLLKEGHTVVGVDDLSVGFMENINDLILTSANFTFCESDIRKLMHKENGYLNFHLGCLDIFTLDMVFHLAARGETYWCQDNPKDAVDVNVNGTLEMLELAKKYSVRHFVFADTSAEYDNIEYAPETEVSNYPESRSIDIYPSTYPTSEFQAPNDNTPRGIYSITKMAGSQFVRTYGELYGFGTTLFRPFNVFGPTMNIFRDIPPVIGAFAKNILEHKNPVIYGDGSKRRDFIYIDDVIDLLMLTFTKRFHKTDTQTFNMGYGENYSVYDIYEIVLNEIYPQVPVDIAHSYASPKFVDDLPGQAQLTLADMRKTTSYFGWKPKIEIKEGVSKTVKAIREKLQAKQT